MEEEFTVAIYQKDKIYVLVGRENGGLSFDNAIHRALKFTREKAEKLKKLFSGEIRITMCALCKYVHFIKEAGSMAKSLVSVPKKKEREDYVRGLIEGEMCRFNKDPEQISVKAGFTSRTLVNKLKSPNTFTLGELYSVLDALDVKIIFARKQQPL